LSKTLKKYDDIALCFSYSKLVIKTKPHRFPYTEYYFMLNFDQIEDILTKGNVGKIKAMDK